MPKFSPKSQRRLDSCHVDLQVIFTEVLRRGYDCSVICGHRSKIAQMEAVDAGMSKAVYPSSKHNSFPSMAVDVAPYFPGRRGPDWNDLGAFYMFAGFVKSVAQDLLAEGKITHRLRYGGDWDGDKQTADQTFNDLPHYELVPKTFDEQS